MIYCPEIYISATPRELDAYRSIVRLTLKQMGAKPVELVDYTVAYGPLEGVLNQLIGRCEAVIHLAGTTYGPEPRDRTLHAPRRSFGHYEVDVAHSLRKPLYAFATTAQTPVPHLPEEQFELRELQKEQRRALEPCETFADGEHLANLIRDLRLELMARRRFARLPHPPLSDRFIGRQQLLGRLRNDVRKAGVVVMHPPEGLDAGGTGRTTVAVELGWELYRANVFPFVFMLPGGSRVELEVGLAALARSDALGLVPDEVASHSARLLAVLKWFRVPERIGKWLLIIDGVDTAPTWARLARFLPELGEGPIIITSRLRAWPNSRAHVVGAFSAEQAREFLVARSGATQIPNRHEQAAIERLSEGMGRVPLALELAAGHLRESKVTALQLLAEHESSARDSPAAHRPPTAAEILDRSLAAVDAMGRGFLGQLMCLAPQPAAIPLHIFEHRGDWPDLRDRLAILESRAIIARDETGRSISIHRAVREMMLERMSEEEHVAALGAALSTVDSALRRGTTVSGTLREEMVPHCMILLGQLNGHPLEIHAVELALTLARWLQESGRPAEAESFYRRALRIEEKRYGSMHSKLAPRLRDLASGLRLRGYPADAEVPSKRALALTEKEFGPEHHEVVGDLYLMAACLRAQSRFFEAEEHLRRACAIEERLVGPLHPRTSIAVQRLAGVLEVSGQTVEAEQLYRRSLSIDEGTFGENHPRIAVLLANLAGLMTRTGRAAEALGLMRRALEIDGRTYGREHPEYVASQKQLAWILDELDQIDEASTLQKSILARDRELLGDAHPEVGADALTLSRLRLDLGDAAGAEELAELSLQIFLKQTRRLRGAHPSIAAAKKLLRQSLVSKGATPESIDARMNRMNIPSPQKVRMKIASNENA